MGRLDEAREVLREALPIERASHGDDSTEVATLLCNLGHVLYMVGMGMPVESRSLANDVEARSHYEEALGILRRVHGERHPSVADAFVNIANILGNVQGQHEEALKMYRKALKIKRRAMGKEHQEVAGILNNIGRTYCMQGKYDEALEMYQEALSTYTRALGIDNRLSAVVNYSMAATKQFSGDVVGAVESARESVRIYSKLGINDERSQDATELLGELEGSG
jgi:tetratricopeptide (TPR) repeat protein